MTKHMFTIIAGVALAGLISSNSHAAPMAPSGAIFTAHHGLAIEPATVVKKKTVVTRNGKVKTKTVVYNPGYHGPRYRTARPGYGYYYGGYYYRSPWWRVPGAVIIVRP